MNEVQRKKAERLLTGLFGINDFSKTIKSGDEEFFIINKVGNNIVSSCSIVDKYNILLYTIYGTDKNGDTKMSLEFLLNNDTINLVFGGSYGSDEHDDMINAFPQDRVDDLVKKAELARKLGYGDNDVDDLLEYIKSNRSDSNNIRAIETTPTAPGEDGSEHDL